VSTVRDIHWYDIVNQEQLLARLALDANRPTNASRITQLLLRSYFPQGVRGVEQYKRAVKFLQATPGAALTFFSHVHEHVPLANVSKLILILQKGSNLALKRLCGNDDGAATAPKKPSKKRNDRAETASDDENKDDNASFSSAQSGKPSSVNVQLTATVQKVRSVSVLSVLWCHLLRTVRFAVHRCSVEKH
jgi:hypothetical protein